MALDASQRKASATVDSVKARLASLTTREKQIMEQVLAGKFNKVIADELNISMRTVEVHRANLFDKMQVKTAVELANLLKTRADASLKAVFFASITPTLLPPFRRNSSHTPPHEP